MCCSQTSGSGRIQRACASQLGIGPRDHQCGCEQRVVGSAGRSVTRTTTRGASCCTAQPAGPR